MDISFETIGGLRAATFLTSLDLEISKRCRGDCLFIRSVILVRPLCQDLPNILLVRSLASSARSLGAPLVLHAHAADGALTSSPVEGVTVHRCDILPRPYAALCPVQVKAWCYYESRLLGAHHGLLSSYALETMVLYIFNIYHRSVKTPFQVGPLCPTSGDPKQHLGKPCCSVGLKPSLRPAVWWHSDVPHMAVVAAGAVQVPGRHECVRLGAALRQHDRPRSARQLP